MNIELYSYKNLSLGTKELMKYACSIYQTMLNKSNNVKDAIRTAVIDSYSSEEKFAYALYLAFFFADNSWGTKLTFYKDLNIDDLLGFVCLKKEDIKILEEKEIIEIYKKYYQIIIAKISNKSEEIKFMSSEVLYSLFYEIFWGNTKILDAFAQNFMPYLSSFKYHKSFAEAYNYALKNGSLKVLDEIEHEEASTITDLVALEKKNYISLNSDKLWTLLEDIKKKFVGQEETVENLFYNIINNISIALNNGDASSRSIIFLDGSTGTGKTAITSAISSGLNVPFAASSITNYSATGYVGGNITDTLVSLYNNAHGDLAKAERGIIVFDEFDKLAIQGNNLEMKKAVQQQLLDFLGGGKYFINPSSTEKNIEFDTSKITFVCLGALSELRDELTNVSNPIGFERVFESTHDTYEITPDDLVRIGLERELVGRFNTYLHTNDYTKEDLYKILTESSISPLKTFAELVENNGKKLVVGEGVLEIIVDEAYKLKTGARSLQTIVNSIRTKYLKEILRGSNDTIYLDECTVLEITGNTFKRIRR